MKAPSDKSQLLLFLGGATVLTILSVSQLPPLPDLFRAPSTPFDRSAPDAAAPDYRLLRQAASVIPPGASVAPLSEPRNPARETVLHREAIALLPGRKVVPAAIWNAPTGDEGRAEFLIVLGARPATAPGDLLLETRDGTIWQRRSR
jgi:hypothetical protein